METCLSDWKVIGKRNTYIMYYILPSYTYNETLLKKYSF